MSGTRQTSDVVTLAPRARARLDERHRRTFATLVAAGVAADVARAIVLDLVDRDTL